MTFWKKAVRLDRCKRAELIEVGNRELSIRKQGELLSIPRGLHYYKPQGETTFNLHPMQIMDHQIVATPFCGVPRMTDFINRTYGYLINENRVRRLYKLMDIWALGPNPYTSKC